MLDQARIGASNLLLADYLDRRFRRNEANLEFEEYFRPLRSAFGALHAPPEVSELLLLCSFVIRQLSPWDRLFVDVADVYLRDIALGFDVSVKGEIGRPGPLVISAPGVNGNRMEISLTPFKGSNLRDIDCPGMLCVALESDALYPMLADALAETPRQRSILVMAAGTPYSHPKLQDALDGAAAPVRHFPGIDLVAGRHVSVCASELNGYEI